MVSQEDKIRIAKRNKKIAEMVDKAVPMREIAQKLGVSTSTVSAYCSKRGLKSKVQQAKSVTPYLVKKWYKLQEEKGYTGAQIARNERFTVETVNMHIRRYRKSLKVKDVLPKTEKDIAILSIDKKCKSVKSSVYKSLKRYA